MPLPFTDRPIDLTAADERPSCVVDEHQLRRLAGQSLQAIPHGNLAGCATGRDQEQFRILEILPGAHLQERAILGMYDDRHTADPRMPYEWLEHARYNRAAIDQTELLRTISAGPDPSAGRDDDGGNVHGDEPVSLRRCAGKSGFAGRSGYLPVQACAGAFLAIY